MQKCNPSRTSACVCNWPKHQIKGAASASKPPLEFLCRSMREDETTQWFNFHFKLTQIHISHLLPEFWGGLQGTHWAGSPSPARDCSHTQACSAVGAGRVPCPGDTRPPSHGGCSERHRKPGAICLALSHPSWVSGWQEERRERDACSLGRLWARMEQLSIITSLRHGNENSILQSCSLYQQGQLPGAGSTPWFLSCRAAYPAHTSPCRAADTATKEDTLLEAEGTGLICTRGSGCWCCALAGSRHWWLLPAP